MLTPVFPHEASPSEGVFIQHQVNALRLSGIEVQLFVCKPWLPEWVARRMQRYHHLRGLNAKKQDASDVHFIRYIQIPKYKFARWTIGSCVQAVTRELGRDALKSFDLIHAQSTWPTGLAAAPLAKELGLPFLVTLHIQDEPALYLGSGRELYDEMLMQASALVAVGSPLARFIQNRKSDAVTAPLTIIPNGVDLEAIEKAVAQPRDTRGNTIQIVSVGNLWKIKGIDVVLAALKELDKQGISNWHYTIVGDGPERASLETLAGEYGLGARVVFTGALPHDQALSHIAASNIFVLPSWNEAFGVVYLEAMACGKPVIGCRGQGAEDIIVDGETGLLVEPRDVSSLVGALMQLLVDPKMTGRIGLLGKQRASKYSWFENSGRFARLYSQMLQHYETD